jgi:hypothetical protein
MSRLIDNLLAYRILTMLIKPFDDTQAYKLGIIDAKGKNLRKSSTLKTSAEKDAYTYLHRLVFNMKKIINRLPGGETKLKSLVAALFLVKEYYQNNDRTTSLMEKRYNEILELVENNVYLVEEEIIVRKFMAEEVANIAGAGVSTDTPAPLKKDVAKYKQIARRKKPVEVV